jgi:hypothetical protein
MAAFAVVCAIVGITNPVWHCDEPAALACELAVKDALDMPKSFERKDVAVLGPSQSRASGLRLRYEVETARGPSQGVAECFFGVTSKPTCLQPNGTYDRCFNLSRVRLDGRFLSDRQIARSLTERTKANVVSINRRDTKLVWVEPDPAPQPSPKPGDAPKPGPAHVLPVYEITAKGLEDYGSDYRRAEPLWAVASEPARTACVSAVKRGSDRPYQALADCLSGHLSAAR